MVKLFQFAVLGLGVGGVYTLLGIGLVLIYRASGVLNFAQTAFAVGGAYLFYQLHYVDHLDAASALAAALVVITGVGLATQHFLMRKLRNSSPLTRLIAALAVLSVIDGLATLKYHGNVILVPSLLPASAIHIGGVSIPENQLLLCGIAVFLTALIETLSNRTVLGLRMRAVSENPQASAALGWSPDRVSLAAWGGGGALGAVAGVLVAPLSGLSSSGLTILLVPVLAAALLGGFSSFWITLAGATLIGIVQSEVTGYFPNIPGLLDAIPFFVIVLYLAIKGGALPSRAHIFEKLPRVGSGIVKPKAIIIACGTLIALMLTVIPVALTNAITVQVGTALVLAGVVIVTGYAGQLSLAPFAMAGIGGYIAAEIVGNLKWPFIVALILAGIGSGLVGVLLGLPALRTRGVSLAIATLGFAVAIDAMLFSNSNYTGGLNGIVIGSAKLFSFSVDPISHPARYATMCVVILTVVAVGVANIRRSRAGRRMIAVRSNERAAAAVGISVRSVKLAAFAMSSALSGLGGVVIVFGTHVAVFGGFDAASSINAVEWGTVGGIAAASGPMLGSGFANGGIGSYILDRFASLNAWLVLIGGLSVLAVLLQNPDGIAVGLASGQGDPLTRRVVRWTQRTARTGRVSGNLELAGRNRANAGRPNSRSESAGDVALLVEGMTVQYGGVVALENFDLRVGAAELVGLVGPNGAGKSTAVDAITGFARLKCGSVRLGDASVEGWAPHKRNARGIARSFQAVDLFEDLSVGENLAAACDRQDGHAYLTGLLQRGPDRLPDLALAAAKAFGISDLLNCRPGDLSYAKRRLVGLARALASDPSILILDEPAAGFDEVETKELGSILQRVRSEWRVGILLIEHDMGLVMDVCDRVVVIDFGRKIAEGSPAEVQQDKGVLSAYLGSDATVVPSAAVSEEPALGGGRGAS